MRHAFARAVLRLDAMAERDNQPRLFAYPRDTDGHWIFTDTHVLFRVAAAFWPAETENGIDLSRWLRVEPDKGRHGVLDGADRVGFRIRRTGKAWRMDLGDPDDDTSRWGEDGLDIAWFWLPDVSVHVNARLLRLALMPARANEAVLVDLAAEGPVWLHGRDWSAAVAPLRHLGKIRSGRVIRQITQVV